MLLHDGSDRPEKTKQTEKETRVRRKTRSGCTLDRPVRPTVRLFWCVSGVPIFRFEDLIRWETPTLEDAKNTWRLLA
jgi:hypothetical protein